jgi:glutathione S-transferase
MRKCTAKRPSPEVVVKLTLYYAPGACSLASHIALEESGLAYEAFRINTAGGEQRTPEYLKINPRGRVPALVADGKTLVENVAIMAFIAGGHPKAGLWPATTWDQAQALSVMSWLAGTVHPAFAHIFRTERYSDDASTHEAIKSKARETFWGCLKEIDALVSGKRWFFGNRFTVVDGYLLVFYRWGLRIHLDMKSLANYTALVERVVARPAVKRVMAEEGIALQP